MNTWLRRILSIAVPILLSCNNFDSFLEHKPESGIKPDQVTLKIVSDIYPTGFNVAWTSSKIQFFAGYKLFYGTTKEFDPKTWLKAKETMLRADTTCAISNLRGSTNYYLRLYVYNGSDSTVSNEVVVATAECKAAQFTGETDGKGAILIPEGCYCDSASYQATLTRPFFMDTTEVTEALWHKVMDVDTSKTLKPRVNTNWYWMILFCNKRSRNENFDTCYTYTEVVFDILIPGKISDLIGLRCDFNKNGYRLPTEDEWEYAYRAGTTTDFYWGKSGNFASGNPALYTYPKTAQDSAEIGLYTWWYANVPDKNNNDVAQKKPNGWRLYDMAGNVQEILWDVYAVRPQANRLDYRGALSGSDRITRGGSYQTDMVDMAASVRRYNIPDFFLHSFLGFRTVRTKL